MGSIDKWAEFFGWCTLLNLGLYLLTIVALALFRDLALRINARLFSITPDEVAREAFHYLGQYKLATTILCFVPYVALKIMS